MAEVIALMAPVLAPEWITQFGHRLLDPKVPVAQRMRIIFALKGAGGSEAVALLSSCLRSEASVLVKHEAAYALGQIGDTCAIRVLVETLQDKKEDPIVRHEAAEALGNLGDEDAAAILRKHVRPDETQEVRETCELALDNLQWNWEHQEKKEHERMENPIFTSVDPAPPTAYTSVPKLRNQLCDKSLPLFQRYRAIFALRNINSEESVLALCQGMETETSSALFRHEVAYVLGQMQHEASIPALVARLRDQREHEMVRHESAEALGSIASPHCRNVLEEYRQDSAEVVRESCEVALDITDYITSTEFSYMESLQP